jgi:hypothetical protein
MRITESKFRAVVRDEINRILEGKDADTGETAYEVEPDGYQMGVQSDDEVIPDEVESKEMDAAQVQAMHSDADDKSTEPTPEEVVDLPEAWERIAFGPRRW